MTQEPSALSGLDTAAAVTPRGRTRLLRSLQAAVLLLGAAQAAQAAQPTAEVQRLRTRTLAASCAHCHGTEGRAVAGEALIRLAGLDKTYMLNQLLAFRTGQRPATIMHQITRGYSQEQLEEVATYFAAQK